MFLRA